MFFSQIARLANRTSAPAEPVCVDQRSTSYQKIELDYSEDPSNEKPKFYGEACGNARIKFLHRKSQMDFCVPDFDWVMYEMRR